MTFAIIDGDPRNPNPNLRFNRAEIVTLAKIHSQKSQNRESSFVQAREQQRKGLAKPDAEGASVDDLDQLHDCLADTEVTLTVTVTVTVTLKSKSKP